MAVGKLDSRNVVQVIPTQTINGRVTVHPNTWYTCPAGKKAIIEGEAVCTGTGAAANTTLAAAGVTIRRCLAAGGGTNPWDRDVAPNIKFSFKAQLDAGETLITTQDAGVNAEWDINAKVQEAPL